MGDMTLTRPLNSGVDLCSGLGGGGRLRPEARDPRRGGVLGEPPPHQLGGLGSAASFLSVVRDEAPAADDFDAF